MKLNIYDDRGKEVVKTYESETYDIMFGTVSAIMDVIKVDQIDNQTELIKVICSAWNELTDVLSGVFPGVTKDEWKYVKVKELVPIIIEIIKFAVTDMLSIPTPFLNYYSK